MPHVLTHLSNDTEHLAYRLLRRNCRPLRPCIVIVFETISISEAFRWPWSLLRVVYMACSIDYVYACLVTTFSKLCCVAAEAEDTRLAAVTLYRPFQAALQSILSQVLTQKQVQAVLQERMWTIQHRSASASMYRQRLERPKETG